MLWQIGTIAICLGLAWGLALLLRRNITPEQMQQRVIRLGVESMVRVLWPLLALILIAIARPILGQWQNVNLLRLAIPLIGSFALIRLAFYVMRRIFARSGWAGGFLQTFEKIFALLVWTGVAIYIVGLWPDLLDLLDQTVVPLGSNKVSLLAICQALVFVAITLILALWAGAALEDRLMGVSMHTSLRVVLGRMGRAVLILIAILISLSLVGIDLTVLSVFGGALGVGIGLGLQKIVSSYVSGFVILLERSLTIGDVVIVDKYSGIVTQINTRYTVVRGLDGVETVVPNEMLLSSPVQNQSLSDHNVRLGTRITVDYETDIDGLTEKLLAAIGKADRVIADPPPHVLMLQFAADGIELEIGFWIADPENGKGGVLSNVNRVIWRTLRENHVKVPYPQREIRLIGK
ncbi:MAG: mechanosensitive ion channel [Burkholderiales bacterium]|nr:mechanosensitive ion channel [Burkholderiales bacterium]